VTVQRRGTTTLTHAPAALASGRPSHAQPHYRRPAVADQQPMKEERPMATIDERAPELTPDALRIGVAIMHHEDGP
jgi:hypothetical protein